MTSKVEVLLNEALTLSENERVEMAEALLESLEPAMDVDVDEAWREEVAKRIAALDAGEVHAVPWNEVRDKLWAKLSDPRQR